MAHTLLTRCLNLIAAMMLITGISLSVQQAATLAELSGYGSSVSNQAQPEQPALRQADAVHTTFYQQADAGIQLILGMLFILLGFFVHGFARSNSERPVHITVVPSRPKRVRSWYWIDIQV